MFFKKFCDLSKIMNILFIHAVYILFIQGTGQTVTIVVQYKPEDYNRFEAKIQDLKQQISQQNVMTGTLMRTSQKKSLYVR